MPPVRHGQTTRDPNARYFVFATGFENSSPVITGKDGRDVRRDEMLETGHYDRWREDFQLVRELGIKFLRYGLPLHRVHRGPGKYDWTFSDQAFNELKRLHIVPVADLCHFGVPDFIGDFQNPDFPELFAEYARAFALRYPWVRLFTPVNEIFICASYSALRGWWNERKKDDRSFVTAIRNLVKANLRAELAIREVQPQALFIQSEFTGYYHSVDPEAEGAAEFLNEQRFVSLDLSYGMDVSGGIYQYLMDNGMPREEYQWLMDAGRDLRSRCVMGNDYYMTNEHLIVSGEGELKPAGEIFGYYVITREYFDRYKLPVMHTETNYRDDENEAPKWLWKEWANVLRLTKDGVPILGFTWYSLLDQIDWDTALIEKNGRVNPLGLYDLDRKTRPVGREYKRLIELWRDRMPLQSMARDMYLSYEEYHHDADTGKPVS